MVKVVLKGSVGFGVTTPDWYRHDTENLAGVTNLPVNAGLGLESVLIFPPTEKQAEKGMVCATILKTVIGDVRCTVYESKNAPGTIYITPPQSREEQEDGKVIYHDEVKMTSKLQAQVLRFIETQVDFVDEETGALDTDLGGDITVPDISLGSIPKNPYAPQA
jgi:hypothetical protein